MAWMGISVLIFYKIMSSVAVTFTYGWKYGLLQFVDLALFVEIYNKHKDVTKSLTFKTKKINLINSTSNDGNGNINVDVTVNNDNNNFSAMKNNSNTSDAASRITFGDNLESTMRFKYLRSLEALMESTPEAVLQIVYLMRTSALTSNNSNNSTNFLFIISIFQSILSITNSTINANHMYMAHSKYKKYKKRFPPSLSFFKHFLFRGCETTYRIGLLSIFWTVVGGEWFALLLGCEMLFPLWYTMSEQNFPAFFFIIKYNIIITT